MSKYILNETPVKTTNGFQINNITVDFDAPTVDKFNIFNIISKEMDKLDIKIDKNPDELLNSKIGLTNKLNYKITINVDKYTNINESVIIEYHFNNEYSKLTNLIEINAEENSNSKFIIKYISDDDNYNFNYLKQITNVKSNATVDVSIIPILNNDSTSLVAIENYLEDNSKVVHNYYDLKGKTRISNYYADLASSTCKNEFNNIYIGKNESLLDMNYLSELKGTKTESNIQTVGVIKDKCKKSYKSTIDFKEGSTKAEGHENENCIILSDDAINKSLPMLLCHEEDVNGSHSVSSGKIDEKKLFYLMTRGLSRKNALKVIVNAEFNKLIDKQHDEELKNDILSIIDKEI